LGKLAGVIGIELPAGLLFAGQPDLHLDPVERVPVRVPDRSEDEGVRGRVVSAQRSRRRLHRNEQRRQQCRRRGHCEKSEAALGNVRVA